MPAGRRIISPTSEAVNHYGRWVILTAGSKVQHQKAVPNTFQVADYMNYRRLAPKLLPEVD
jgi:hypothetical protein